MASNQCWDYEAPMAIENLEISVICDLNCDFQVLKSYVNFYTEYISNSYPQP